jgi:transcriptional regulator with XRE-family HTH domain
MQQIPVPPTVPLRALREAHGLSSTQLACRIAEQGVDVHPDSLINIELGRKRGSTALMAAWARALGIKHLDIRQADRITELASDVVVSVA